MGDIVRALTITTHSQIKKLVDQAKQKQDGDLINCIIALASLQDNVGETEWIKMVEAAASVQRKYIWTIEQLHKQDLGEVIALKLQNLTMETDLGQEVANKKT